MHSPFGELQPLPSSDSVKNRRSEADDSVVFMSSSDKCMEGYPVAQGALSTTRKKIVILFGTMMIVVGGIFLVFENNDKEVVTDRIKEDLVDVQDMEGSFVAGEIQWVNHEDRCSERERCKEGAEQFLLEGVRLLKETHRERSIKYKAYQKLKLAEAWFRGAGLEKEGTLKYDIDRLGKELSESFRELHLNYIDAKVRRLTDRMIDILEEVKETFSYEGAREYRWALEQEKELRIEQMRES